MPGPLASFLTGALSEANKQRQANQKLAKDLFLAKQKAQLATIDAGEALNQIKLNNIIKRINEADRLAKQKAGQQVGQPQGQPVGQPGQQPSFRPQGQQPQQIQPTPREQAAQQSLIDRGPVASQARPQMQQQLQPQVQQKQEPFIRIPTGQYNEYTNEPIFELKPNPEYVSSAELEKLSMERTKFSQEQKDRLQLQKAKKDNLFESTIDTLNSISTIEKGIKNFGVFGDIPSIPGTSRTVWEANVNKLLSQKVLDVMTKLKEVSKTGATGFGQLNRSELNLLKNAATRLKRNLPPEVAQEYLNEMKEKLNKVLSGIEQQQPQQGQGPVITQQQRLQSLKQKYGLQ